MRLTLTTPIPNPFGKSGEKYTILEVRDHLTVGDLLAARRLKDVDDLERDCAMIARVCGVQTRDLDDLDMIDLVKLQKHLAAIMAKANPPEEGEDSPKA